MLEHLSAQVSYSAIAKALSEFPQDADAFYSRIPNDIDRLQPRLRQIAHKLLRWIGGAIRPLKVSELDIAIVVALGQLKYDPKKRIAAFRETLLRICVPLVEIKPTSDTVNLTHASVRDYLLSQRSYPALTFNLHLAHASLAEACLLYLCYEDQKYIRAADDEQTSIRRFEKHLRLEPNQFLEYSAIYWVHHVISISTDSTEKNHSYENALYHFASSETLLLKWLQTFFFLDGSNRTGAHDSSIMVLGGFFPTELSAESDLASLFRHRGCAIFRQHNEWAQSGRFIRFQRLRVAHRLASHILPPIIVAAHFNFLQIVKDEVERGADVNTRDFSGQTVLLWAARTDSVHTMEYLIENGATINDQANNSRITALYQAVHEDDYLWNKTGTFDAARFLLNIGSDVNLRFAPGRNILHALLFGPRDDKEQASLTADLVRSGGSKSNGFTEVDWRGEGPLYWSMARGKSRITRAMLESTKSILDPSVFLEVLNRKTPAQLTVLQIACIQNCEMARLFIEAGADIHTKATQMQWTALHTVVQVMPELVPDLLAHKADPNVTDINNDRPLHFAARGNRVNEIVVLFEAGGDLEAENDKGRTPLMIAVLSKSDDSARILIKLGARRSRLSQELGHSISLLSLADDRYSQDTARTHSSDYNQFLVGFILRKCSPRTLPLPIVSRIFDLAHYWLETTAYRDDYLVVVQRSPLLPYVKSTPIIGRLNRPVQRITFKIGSHDQGYDDSKGASGIWSWFEARRVIKERVEDPRIDQSIPREVGTQKSFAKWSNTVISYPLITRNELASRQPKTHVISWPEDAKRAEETEKVDWLDGLVRGDVVAIVPKALYPD